MRTQWHEGDSRDWFNLMYRLIICRIIVQCPPICYHCSRFASANKVWIGNRNWDRESCSISHWEWCVFSFITCFGKNIVLRQKAHWNGKERERERKWDGEKVELKEKMKTGNIGKRRSEQAPTEAKQEGYKGENNKRAKRKGDNKWCRWMFVQNGYLRGWRWSVCVCVSVSAVRRWAARGPLVAPLADSNEKHWQPGASLRLGLQAAVMKCECVTAWCVRKCERQRKKKKKWRRTYKVEGRRK